MKQVVGFIKAFYEDSDQSTGLVYNFIPGEISKYDFDKKEIYWGTIRNNKLYLHFRWDYENGKFSGGGICLDHLNNPCRRLDEYTGRPVGINIYELDEETCDEIKNLNLQPINMSRNETNTGK